MSESAQQFRQQYRQNACKKKKSMHEKNELAPMPHTLRPHLVVRPVPSPIVLTESVFCGYR